MKLQFVFALIAFAWGSSALAQPRSAVVDARQRLLDEAFDLSNAGQHERALELAWCAGDIRMSPSLRHFLAEEHEALSREPGNERHIPDAFWNAERCVEEADRDATIPDRVQMLDECRAMVARLAPRIARLVVHVPDGAPAELEVRVADVLLDRSHWERPHPVLPGMMRVTTRLGDAPAWEETLSLSAGESRELTVGVPQRAVRPPPTPRGNRVAPWVVVGLGALSYGAAGVLIERQSNARDLREWHCPPASSNTRDLCPDQAAANTASVYREDELLYFRLSVAALTVGTLAVTGGVLWAALGRRSSRPPVAWAILPTVGGWALTFGGAL